MFIGESLRYLQTRLTEHARDIKNNLKNTATHAFENKHNFDFNKTTILNTEQNYHKRKFLEIIYIAKEKKLINFKTDIEKLGNIYLPRFFDYMFKIILLNLLDSTIQLKLMYKFIITI